MDVILPALYQANVGALGLEFANPRRQHETAALRRHKLPDRMLLIAGVIDSKSNFIEHPEVVAQRIEAGYGRSSRLCVKVRTLPPRGYGESRKRRDV
jgi:methionine synthase II (cobalamin-independent)